MGEFNIKQDHNYISNCGTSTQSPPIQCSYLNNSSDEQKGTGSVKLEINEDPIREIKTEIPDTNEPAAAVNKNSTVEENVNLLTVNHELYVVMCDICDFQTQSHREMDIHRLSHTLRKKESNPPYYINIIPEPATNAQQNIQVKRKAHACDVCPYTAKTSQQLHSHKKSHSLEKEYSCSQCNYKCKYLSGLRYHELSHANVKLFTCDECSFNCMTAGLLKSHKRKHSDAAPFVCKYCLYRCKYPAGLRYHMLTHTKGKDVQCNTCDYSCRTPSELKIHSRTHDPQPMTCEFCGFTCKIRKTLEKHKNSACKYQNS